MAKLNRETHLTVLVAEQNSAIAVKYSHHATVIENGCSVLDGPAKDLAARGDIRALYLGGTPEDVSAP